MSDAVLAIRDLTIEIATDRASTRPVDGVSLDVQAGEILCVVGESGSGKSLTMLAAIGLLPPVARVSGAIHFRGEDLARASASARRALRGRDIAMVFQDPMAALNPAMRIGAQLTEAIAIHRPDTTRKERRLRVIAAMTEVHIPNPEARFAAYPHELSGGMRQRVMIAMALLHRPGLLIADEPTTALDVTVQAQVLLVLRTLRDTTDTAIILITHDLGVVAETADRVVVFYGGRVMEQAPAAALLANPRHPYSAGLLASLPELQDAAEEAYAIPGAPPSATNRPSGCVFHPRCALRADRALCVEAVPHLRGVGPDHLAACHFAEEVPLWAETVFRPARRDSRP